MERFDDERERNREPKITLSNGKEYTEREIFERLYSSKEQDRDLKKALYVLIMSRPIEICFDNDTRSKEIAFEDIFNNRERMDRTKFSEVPFVIDGKEYDSLTCDILESNGYTFHLR